VEPAVTAGVRWVFALVVAAVLVLGTPGPSFAHTELVGSAPAEGAVADRAVTSITFTLESTVSEDLAQVVVVGEDGADRVVGGTSVQGSVVTVPIRPLDVAGAYAVSYRVVAVDGHPISGSYRFTVSEVSARDAQLMSDQLLTDSGTLPPGQANQPETASAWGDLAPELGIVLLALLIFGAAMVRRSQVRRYELGGAVGGEPQLVGQRHD